MTSSRRLPALISAAVALPLALGSCSLIEDASQLVGMVGEDAVARASLASMVADLESLSGVESASYELESDTYQGDVARVHVTAVPTLDGEQLRALANLLRDSFTAVELTVLEPRLVLKLEGDATGKFDIWGLAQSNEFLVDSFEFWRTTSAAVKTELWVEILPGTAGEPGIRSVAIPHEADLDEAADQVIQNYAALQAVSRDAGDSRTYWQVAGIKSLGELAPLEFAELVSDLREFVPLLDYSEAFDMSPGDPDYPEGFQARWASSDVPPGIPEISIVSNEYTDESWKSAILAAVRTAQMENVNFQFSGGDRNFWIHTSACFGSVQPTADDAFLFDALLSYSVTMAFGAGAGSCVPQG